MSTHAPSTPTCILGLGLIGGCLMRDVAAAGGTVFGWNRSSGAVNRAAQEGFDVSDDLVATLRRAEEEGALVVIGVPMPAVPAMLDAVKEFAPTCGLTDVVSVKQAVYDEILARGMQERYVGAHPMAGTAESGWDATFTGLFDGAPWVVCYDHADDERRAGRKTSPEWRTVFRAVVELGVAVGSEVIAARARHHDRAVARVSHLPHLLAEALAVVGDSGGVLTLSLAAGSFRDGTRVAGTAPHLVRAMCENNSAAVLDALDEALRLLASAREELAVNGSAEKLVEAGYISRQRYEARSGTREAPGGVALSHRPTIRIRPGDRGWIAQLEHAEHLGARIEIA